MKLIRSMMTTREHNSRKLVQRVLILSCFIEECSSETRVTGAYHTRFSQNQFILTFWTRAFRSPHTGSHSSAESPQFIVQRVRAVSYA